MLRPLGQLCGRIGTRRITKLHFDKSFMKSMSVSTGEEKDISMLGTHYTLEMPTRSSFELRLPGWSSSDINIFHAQLHQPWYLRVWRVPILIDWTIEMVKKAGSMLDSIDYEKTNLTYHKCISLDRCASLSTINDTDVVPYYRGISVKSGLSKIGKTSFQTDSEVCETESGLTMFRSSLVTVSVDAKTRQPTGHPDWWVEKFKSSVRQSEEFKPLRVSLPKSHPQKNLLWKSSVLVQPMDLDYYGHANNTTYIRYAMDGLLAAHHQNKLDRWTYKELENSIKNMEFEFISDCTFGDRLENCVYRDEQDQNKLYVDLLKEGKVIFSQSVMYDLLSNKL